MNREELDEILELHKKWINGESDGERADLRGADLRWADLSRADLSKADLRGADLRVADLSDADLRWANLSGANLSKADLRWANLSMANLSGADLDYSCLPLWCGSLTAKMDDRQVIQLLYHTLSIVKYSNNVSKKLKEKLLTEQNLDIAKRFHRADECNKL